MVDSDDSRARVQATLHAIGADIERHARQSVIVIGSAAACLAGASVDVADVDLFTTVDDAECLRRVWSASRIDSHAPDGDDRFRSRFSRYAFEPLPVEVMGRLDVCVDGVWQELTVADTLPIAGQSAVFRIPTVAEQVRVLELFDRPKDHRRARCLRNLVSVSTHDTEIVQ